MLDEIWVFRRCFDFISILNGKMPSCQHTFFSVTKSGESTFFQPGRTEPLKKNKAGLGLRQPVIARAVQVKFIWKFPWSQ